MTRPALALLVAWVLGGCLPTRTFPCASDADCMGAEGARCEIAWGVCSFADPDCESGRRFGAYAGALTGTCTEPIAPRPLTNACVAGEPWPTTHDPCAAQVCAVLPACCEVTWSEPCVRIAEQKCSDIACARSLAVTGEGELRVLTWNGSAYATTASIPGPVEKPTWLDARDGRPRIALGRSSAISVMASPDAEPPLEVIASYGFGDKLFGALAAIDINADDVVDLGIGYASVPMPQQTPRLEIMDQATKAPIITALIPPILSLAWADYNGDRRADVAIATTSPIFTGYALFYRDGQTFEKAFDVELTSVTSVSWGDVDGNGTADLIAFGDRAAVHLNSSGSVIPGNSQWSARIGMSAVGTVGDIDGDDRADLVISHRRQDGASELIVFYGFGGSPLASLEAMRPLPLLTQLALADVDRDGRLDVIGALAGGGLIWVKNLSTVGAIMFDEPAPIPEASLATWFAATGWPGP